MREEYDFTNAEKGKFYSPDARLNIPVYLDQEVADFIEAIAKRKGTDLSSVANQILRGNMKLAEVMK